MFSRRFEGGFYLVIALTEITSLDLGVRSVPPLTRLLAVFVLDGILVQGQWPSNDCAGEVIPVRRSCNPRGVALERISLVLGLLSLP